MHNNLFHTWSRLNMLPYSACSDCFLCTNTCIRTSTYFELHVQHAWYMLVPSLYEYIINLPLCIQTLPFTTFDKCICGRELTPGYLIASYACAVVDPDLVRDHQPVLLEGREIGSGMTGRTIWSNFENSTGLQFIVYFLGCSNLHNDSVLCHFKFVVSMFGPPVIAWHCFQQMTGMERLSYLALNWLCNLQCDSVSWHCSGHA